MAQKDRNKQFWLIPKRSNLHQTICLLDGIEDRKYDKTSWNTQKQDNLGVNLKRWGATKDGKNISPQALRTLVASVPQYLGFLYINSNTTPNTICITKAGHQLLNTHKKDLVKMRNLVEGKNDTIKESKIALQQMEKLQITNPIILKDCKNILVFPFRSTIRILLELDYLDREEIAYFLFKLSDESEIKLKIQEIKNFRKLSNLDRWEIISKFKATHLGNISLVKAPSASYYENLCMMTGIVEVKKDTPSNSNVPLNCLHIKDDCLKYAKEMLDTNFFDTSTYDFGDNLDLWIDYIGDPIQLFPPIDVQISNTSNSNYFIQILKDGVSKEFEYLESKNTFFYPVFLNNEYIIEIIDEKDGTKVYTKSFVPNADNLIFNIEDDEKGIKKEKSANDIILELLEHSSRTNFNKEMLNKLKVIKSTIGIDKSTDKQLRGAHYEHLFFQFLTKLKDDNIINDVIWNGKISKYGLPVQAPGGKTGTVDMVFIKDDVHYVLELTTIKSKSGQEKAEAISVPDHIKLYKDSMGPKVKVVGIYCAPLIHERITNMMKTVTTEMHGISLVCITDKSLVEILKNEDFSKKIGELAK
ncbi:MAG: AlwI family type II restriction endonuclease [Erysipelotrichaceae bacterium]